MRWDENDSFLSRESKKEKQEFFSFEDFFMEKQQEKSLINNTLSLAEALAYFYWWGESLEKGEQGFSISAKLFPFVFV